MERVNVNEKLNWTKKKKICWRIWLFVGKIARKFGDWYDKKLMDTGIKAGIDAAKTASKRVVQKTTEAIGDLIGNKTADKTTSADKTKK